MSCEPRPLTLAFTYPPKIRNTEILSKIYEFVFHVEPCAKGRPKFTAKGFAYTPKKTRDAESELKLLMRSKWSRPPLEKPLKLDITFSITRPKSVKRDLPAVKPDIDNLIKLCTDSGNKILWNDDNQIVELSAKKVYGPPSIWLAMREL